MENKLGQNISIYLRENNMSQRELARRIGSTEVSIGRYISGERTPKIDVVMKIAETFNVTIDNLVGNEKDDPETEYNIVWYSIIHNANKWTKDQKAVLVNMLFGLNK